MSKCLFCGKEFGINESFNEIELGDKIIKFCDDYYCQGRAYLAVRVNESLYKLPIDMRSKVLDSVLISDADEASEKLTDLLFSMIDGEED